MSGLFVGLFYAGYMLPTTTLTHVLFLAGVCTLAIYGLGFCIRYLAISYGFIPDNEGNKKPQIEWLELALSPAVLLVFIWLIF